MSSKLIIYLFLAVISISYSCKSPDKSNINGLNEYKIDTIPFTLNNANNIIIPAVINHKDTLDMMFHLAEGSISIIKEVIDSLKSINLEEEANTVKAWGGNASAKYAENNTITIGNTTQDSITIHETGLSGYESDGKFGPNFYGDKILEIDFDKNILFIHDSIPNTIKSYTRYELEMDRGMMFLAGVFSVQNEMVEHQFLLHTGYAGRLLIDDEMAHKYKLDKKLKTISEGELKDSHGNVIKTKKAILPSIRFKDHQFKELPISFFSGSIGRQKMSVMGCDLIRRFNLILDSKNAQLYLKPNDNFDLPYTQS